MEKTSYTYLSKACQFVEDHAYARQSEALHRVRSRAEENDLSQGSAVQAEFLHTLALMTHSTSVITVGTGSVVEIMQLIDALGGSGQLTAVDSSAQGIAFIRGLFAGLSDDTQTTLRAVNAPVGVFLPRLNGADYDMIVVSGDAGNYLETFEQAPRLLRDRGVIVFTDVLALASDESNGGVLNPADRSEKALAMRQLLETVQADERFDSTLTATGTGLLIAVKR
ncbi:O-methyltransferase [Bifidobacterium goeldii]|uniref:O-methyltransferase n=1 Tax=Bifidobacterium goeldii TaxID=2306975 RepID=A0A430FMS2_9BIFI|nr:methyltransferase [Bifidobacterium goeldii]RSX54121.1 O-methyltransferase [Bifidobacterium goeldii]